MIVILTACAFHDGERYTWQGESEHWHLRYVLNVDQAGEEVLLALLKYKKRMHMQLLNSDYNQVDEPPINIIVTSEQNQEIWEVFLDHNGSVEYNSNLCCFYDSEHIPQAIEVSIGWNGQEESFVLTREK